MDVGGNVYMYMLKNKLIYNLYVIKVKIII